MHYAILAQHSDSVGKNIFETLSTLFGKPDMLAHPGQMVNSLQSLSIVWAVIFLAAGLVCMLQGFHYYKSITITLAAAIGSVCGYYLGKKIGAEYIVAACLGALLAVGCFPMMKYAVAVVGGLVGAFLGANVWTSVTTLATDNTQLSQNCWIGAIIGLIICGMLAFILFKVSVVLFTSVSGSTIAVIGGLALLLQMPLFKQRIVTHLSDAHVAVIPLMVMVPAVIGLILQYAMGETSGEKAEAKE